jgi:SAM-dependent methyltransferase
MSPESEQSFDSIQVVQEQEYEFPYHYIPRRDNRGASTCIRWHWGLEYLVGLDVAMHHLIACNPASLLDIGCGDGRFLRDVRQRTQIGELLGVDYSARAIALARALNPSLRYEQFDVTAASLPTQYDAAALIEVVEHIPPASMNEFLAGARRCIRSGGTLVVTVPHSNMPVAKKHYQHFTSETLRSTLERHFRVERIVPFGHMPGILRVAANLAGLSGGRVVVDSPRLGGWVYERFLRSCLAGQPESICARLLAVARV